MRTRFSGGELGSLPSAGLLSLEGGRGLVIRRKRVLSEERFDPMGNMDDIERMNGSPSG